jgi:crotonobetainyl-CoA:carnitine CoA-transferase CaiB-like acyl-CoA transferase
MASTSALAGIRVIDLTNLLPGPYATMILGDFGADVIKVERPSVGDPGRSTRPVVDGESMRHQMLNRNKRSIVLDLKGNRDRETLLALVAGADVLVEGFRSGTMQRLGLGYETLAAVNPQLIYCSLNGFGPGPEHPPAHDINFMALAGLLVSDPESGRCDLPPTQFADLAGGALHAVIGVLLALSARQTTGYGQHVDVSMVAGALALQTEALAHLNAGEPWTIGASRLTGRYPCYNVYATRDRRFVAVGATEPAFWRNLCVALELPDLADDQYAEGDRGREVVQMLTQRFLARTLAEWETRLGGLETCCTAVRTFEESVAGIEGLCPGFLVEQTATSGRSMLQFLSPISLSETPAAVRTAAPLLDASRDDVLRELGAFPPVSTARYASGDRPLAVNHAGPRR